MISLCAGFADSKGFDFRQANQNLVPKSTDEVQKRPKVESDADSSSNER